MVAPASTANTLSGPYRGRFAPSPTGPLHFGSLVTAVASYLQARANNGEWLVRVEDIDPPREVAGSADQILRSLEAHGLQWDGELIWQSKHLEQYEDALQSLLNEKLAFYCTCTRKQLIATAEHGPLGIIYPGTCRHSEQPALPDRAVRLITAGEQVTVNDLLQEQFTTDFDKEVGDFLLRRGDGLIAYHLAVTVDDAAQGITEIVRGIDLLPSTACQNLLQQRLGLPVPAYAHIPVAVNEDGQKLSKQTGASALNDAQPVANLWQALSFLGQQPPAELSRAALHELWQWAQSNWSILPLRGIKQRGLIGHFP